jgi:hypothetical protein
MSEEPIVVWGPGSEWFWIMLQTVVVTVTLVGIYFQFRLQRAANAFEQLNRMGEQWESEQTLRARLDAARAIAGGGEAPEASLNLIGNYWENIATLVRQGHVNERVVAETYGNNTTLWWSALEGPIRALRDGRLDATIFENFEWLAHRFIEDEANSGPGRYDRATLTRVMEAATPLLEARVRIAEESRMAPERRAPRSRRGASAE